MMSVSHQSNCKKAAKCARESGWRSPFALLLVHYRLFKSLSANRAGREISNVVTLHPGKLPISEDGVHTNAEGQFILGKVTATAVEEFYKAKE